MVRGVPKLVLHGAPLPRGRHQLSASAFGHFLHGVQVFSWAFFARQGGLHLLAHTRAARRGCARSSGGEIVELAHETILPWRWGAIKI